MSEVDQILTPIAGSNPCGIDLEYDSRFQAIKGLVDSGNDENPTDWRKVKKQCLELLNDGRSVDLLVFLLVAMVATEGYQGLVDGVRVFAKSIEDFWDTIYPELDMDDPEDERYDIRLNTVAQLGEKPGKLGDQLRFVEKVLRSPLSMTNQRISASFWPIWENESTGTADSSELGLAQSHMGQLSYEDKKAISDSVSESIKHLQKLGEFLMDKTGLSYNAPFDNTLIPVLKQIGKSFSSPGQPAEGTDAEGGEVVQVNQANVPPPPPPGTISSREDVKEALGKIIEYYRQNEPSSPVPYFALRTQELVDSDFMEVIKNLSKESEMQFKKVLNIQ